MITTHTSLSKNFILFKKDESLIVYLTYLFEEYYMQTYLQGIKKSIRCKYSQLLSYWFVYEI